MEAEINHLHGDYFCIGCGTNKADQNWLYIYNKRSYATPYATIIPKFIAYCADCTESLKQVITANTVVYHEHSTTETNSTEAITND